MQLQATLLMAILATRCAAQTLDIPTRVGSKVVLSAPSTISGVKDMGNKEYDRGQPCNSDEDTGSDNAVFILKDGATLSNVIIGADSLEGVHCEGACTLKNVWFRDVCEGRSTSSSPPHYVLTESIRRYHSQRNRQCVNPRGRRTKCKR